MGLSERIMVVASSYKKELAGISNKKVCQHITDGTCLIFGSSFLLWSASTGKKYYGVPVKTGTIFIDYLASGVKGKGEAEELLSIVKRKGEDIILMVRADNPRAIAFYKKHGFSEVKTVSWKTYESIIMVWRASV